MKETRGYSDALRRKVITLFIMRLPSVAILAPGSAMPFLRPRFTMKNGMNGNKDLI